jgi:hypothetical protein
MLINPVTELDYMQYQLPGKILLEMLGRKGKEKGKDKRQRRGRGKGGREGKWPKRHTLDRIGRLGAGGKYSGLRRLPPQPARFTSAR